jgi:hypothetical protein
MTLKSASPMAVYIPKLFNNSYLNTDKFNKPSFILILCDKIKKQSCCFKKRIDIEVEYSL